MNTYPNPRYPHTIENGHGEKLTMLRYVEDGLGGYIECENEVAPKAGPPMHVHWKQDESLTVTEGRIGVEIQGQPAQFFGPGETVTFTRGTYHRFWNAGNTTLRCTGWVKPALNFEYFLSNIYDSIRENPAGRPGTFESAYLLDRYKSEFDMSGIPSFVKKVIFPISLFFGKLQGKHKKFANAPKPIK